MKLSMWLLQDWLADYICESDIKGGSAHITGIRFFTEELPEYLPQFVYIGPGTDVLSDLDYANQIVLVHGYDLLFLEGISIQNVVNEVLSAIDYYNSWEKALMAAATEKDAIQLMVDASREVMHGPMAIADSSGHVLAFTQSEGPQTNEPGWQYLAEHRLVPNAYTNSKIKDVDGNQLSDWSSSPRIYHMKGFTCIGSQIVIEGESVAAFFMQEFDKPFNHGDVQLAMVFCDVLAAVATTQREGNEIAAITAITSAWLSGEEPDEYALARLSGHLASVVGSSPYQLVLIESATASVNIVRKNSLLETIRNLEITGIFLTYENALVCLVAQHALDSFLSALKAYINPSHYAIGVSYPADGCEQIPSRYKQAQFAIALSAQAAGIFYCQDQVFKRILVEVKRLNHELEIAHPALLALKAYDAANNTEFQRTLELYLRNERNMVKTAEELCIHRNSMKYRMKRIRELIAADLEDPEVRLHLLLSFYLD